MNKRTTTTACIDQLQMRPPRTEHDKYLAYEKHLEDSAEQHNEEDTTQGACLMNYQIILIFHSDINRRPCRPVVRLITLPEDPKTSRNDATSNPRGLNMTTMCQLCGASSEPSSELTVDTLRIHSVYAVAVTDAEARYAMHAIADINMQVAMRHIAVSHRSNFALVPRVLHRVVPVGVSSIFHLRVASSVTDVQVAVLMLRESLSPVRAITLTLQTLHPYMTTPENLKDAVCFFTRKLDAFCFKSGSFRFDAL